MFRLIAFVLASSVAACGGGGSSASNVVPQATNGAAAPNGNSVGTAPNATPSPASTPSSVPVTIVIPTASPTPTPGATLSVTPTSLTMQTGTTAALSVSGAAIPLVATTNCNAWPMPVTLSWMPNNPSAGVVVSAWNAGTCSTVFADALGRTVTVHETTYGNAVPTPSPSP